MHLSAVLTNGSDQTCTYDQGAERGWAVVHDGSVVWKSGCSDSPDAHSTPQACPDYEAVETLSPGQQVTTTQDWAQQADSSGEQVAAGSYQPQKTVAGQTASTTITID